MMGRRFMPHVPPSTTCTSGGRIHSSWRRCAASRPSPSSPINGLPRPITVVPRRVLAIDELLVGANEAPAGDDRRHRPAAVDDIRPDGEVNVNRDEDEECPTQNVVNQ